MGRRRVDRGWTRSVADALGRGIALGLIIVFAAAVPVRAEIEVIDEEVIFTLLAPQAKEVFLVGDFNNWNATLEKMDKIGDTFEVRLFLVTGTYRYKFVVDGTSINDPDNTGGPNGSVIKLVIRGGELAIGGEEPVAVGGALGVQPSLRYAGAFNYDDNKTEPRQDVDLYFTYDTERLRSRINLKSTDDTWRTSPPTTDVRLNDAYVEAHFENAMIGAFENQDTWTSSDPFSLVGNVGIYDYNAGLGRKGGAIVLGKSTPVKLRVLYTDRTEAGPVAAVTIPAGDLAGFAASSSPDTTVYRYNPVFEDEDAWAFDLSGDFAGLDIGFGSRRNRGYHPGVLATIARGTGDFDYDLYTVRNYWVAGVTWVSWQVADALTLDAAYGYSDTKMRKIMGMKRSVSAIEDVVVNQGATPADGHVAIQNNHRVRAGVTFAFGDWTAGFGGERLDFDFEMPGRSTADIWRGGVNASYAGDRWQAAASMTYFDQRYGSSPDDFHLFTSYQNQWLDYADDLTLAHIAMFDRARASDVGIDFQWDGVDSTAVWGGFVVHSTLDLTMKEVVASLEYTAFRLAAEYRLPRRFYIQGDGRIAHYDKPAWNVRDTYSSAYVEFGFRNPFVEISLGAGIDPVVLNRVTNRYENIGREEFIREAIPALLGRSDAAAFGAAVAQQERKLQDLFPIKLEAIVRF